MLIILPPSETKRRPSGRGVPLSLDKLSFPELTPTRRRVIEALVETSRAPDALQRLRVRPSLMGDVAANEDILESSARPALEVYSGPLFLGLDESSLPDAARARAHQQVLITSALWGAIRPRDSISAYRLHVCSKLIGIEKLEPEWRKVMPAVLADAAGPAGAILDLRSPTYQAMGRPRGLGERTVMLRVEPAASQGRVGDVVAKRIRGEAARCLLESGADPDGPEIIAVILGERWPVRLREPARTSAPWSLTIVAG